jgi:hypothetical protein
MGIDMDRFVRVAGLATLLLAISLALATSGASAQTSNAQVTQLVINDQTYSATLGDFVDVTTVDGYQVVQYLVDNVDVYLIYVDSVQPENLVAAFASVDGSSTVRVNSCSNCVQSVNNVIYAS